MAELIANSLPDVCFSTESPSAEVWPFPHVVLESGCPARDYHNDREAV